MSILDFAELERLNTARTPGPWDAREQRSADPRFFINFEIRGPDPDPSSKYEWPTRVCQSVVGQVREEGDRRDFAFIAAMANTADELLRLARIGAALDLKAMSAAELIEIAKDVAERDGYGAEDWRNGSASWREQYVQIVGKTIASLGSRSLTSSQDQGEKK